jgi:SAM-dependent methyltransferase
MSPTSPSTVTQHYDADYFKWQSQLGAFGGIANRFKFQPHIRPTDRVVDFGCGGGYLLANLVCAERRGVELNPIARLEAQRNGVNCVASTDDLPDCCADVLISNSALEHVEHPLVELRRLLPKVRPGGTVVFVVPHETLASKFDAADINKHLYTWSPLALGNLFSAAGFEVAEVRPSRLMWPPAFRQLLAVFGERAFQVICRIYRTARMALWPLKPVDSHASIIILARRPVGVPG